MSSPSNGDYKGPDVEVGQSVLWYPHGNKALTPCAAIVAKVGNHNLALALVTPELRDFVIKDGVYHLSDSRAKKPEGLENGAWDHTPAWKRFLAVEEKVMGSKESRKP